MAGYIGTQAVSVNTTSATISDDLAVGDDALITGTLTTTAATVFNGGFASNADSTITIDDNGYNLTLISTDADENSGPRLKLQRNSANPAADDFIGLIDFTGQDAGGNETRYANIVTQIASPTAGGEGGKFIIEVATHDAEMQKGFEIIDGNAEDELDVNIGSGNASLTTIAGNATITSDLTVTGVSLFRDGTAGAPAISNTGDTNTGILFPSADAIGFSTAGTENLRLSTTNLSFASGGSAVSASNLVGVSFMIFSGQGQLRVGNSSTSAKNSVEFFNGNGQVGIIATNGSSTAYNTSSDYRLKENVDYSWDATTRLKQLKPARFNFIVDDTNTLVDGFLAHEAQAVVPEAVHGTHNEVDDDGVAVMQGIDQAKLVPLLVKTIQELEARITALEG